MFRARFFSISIFFIHFIPYMFHIIKYTKISFYNKKNSNIFSILLFLAPSGSYWRENKVFTELFTNKRREERKKTTKLNFFLPARRRLQMMSNRFA